MLPCPVDVQNREIVRLGQLNDFDEAAVLPTHEEIRSVQQRNETLGDGVGGGAIDLGLVAQ